VPWVFVPVNLELVDDALDAVNFAEQFLGDLLVVEGLHASVQDYDPFVIGPSDFVAQKMRAVLESVIDACLQFIVRCRRKGDGNGRELRNRHGSTFKTEMGRHAGEGQSESDTVVKKS
jgi:hypothetical protein